MSWISELFGGGSNTSSTTTTTTTNQDNRVALESGIGLSSQTSDVVVNVLDNGAVKESLDLIESSQASQANQVKAVLALADTVFGRGVDVLTLSANAIKAAMDAGAETQQSAYESVATAWGDAKGSPSVDRNLLLMGLAMIAAWAWSRA
jgi:hypothetical protein